MPCSSEESTEMRPNPQKTWPVWPYWQLNTLGAPKGKKNKKNSSLGVPRKSLSGHSLEPPGSKERHAVLKKSERHAECPFVPPSAQR